MKTLVNWITFVWKYGFANDIDNIFLLYTFCSTTLEDTAAFYWWTRSSDDAFFLMGNILLIVRFSTKNNMNHVCVNLMGFWQVLCLFNCPKNFSDKFVKVFFFSWNTWWFDARYIFFYISNIYYIYDILLGGGNLSCFTLFDEPDI